MRMGTTVPFFYVAFQAQCISIPQLAPKAFLQTSNYLRPHVSLKLPSPHSPDTVATLINNYTFKLEQRMKGRISKLSDLQSRLRGNRTTRAPLLSFKIVDYVATIWWAHWETPRTETTRIRFVFPALRRGRTGDRKYFTLSAKERKWLSHVEPKLELLTPAINMNQRHT